MEERIPPHDLEAEKAVLGAMFLDGDAVKVAVDELHPSDFYRIQNAIIFETITLLREADTPVDMVTVVDKLRQTNRLEDVGGMAYVMSVADAVPSSANIKYHADIVAGKARMRELISVASNIMADGYNSEDDTEEIIDRAEQKILSVASKRRTKDVVLMQDAVAESVSSLEKRIESKGGIVGIPTGFVDLDKLTCGLQKSDLLILAARPAMGKTAFALNIAENVALYSHIQNKRKTPYGVAVFSLEMSREQLVNRMLCSEGSIDMQRLKNGTLSDDEWERFWKACQKLSEAKIYIDDTPAISVNELRSSARKIQAEYGLDLIVIDYLQLMQGAKGGKRIQDRQQEVSEISRSLKCLARELDVPIIALSQLSRSVETRQSKRPMLSDLRESGSLEQDADIVAFLYREDYYEPDTDIPNVTELIIAKHRSGATDTVNLFFKKEYSKFLNLTKRE